MDLWPLAHSWPLFERDRQFDLGIAFDAPDLGTFDAAADHADLARLGIGLWDCDLSDDRLTWSDGVHDLFGLPRGVRVERSTAVALYAEGSRVAMERLRAYAIRHRRGFTLDVEIRPANGGRRWVRLAAAPLCNGMQALRLQGLKRDVTNQYRRSPPLGRDALSDQT